MADTTLLITDFNRNRVPKYVLAAISSWFGSISLGTVIGYTATAIPSLKSTSSHVQLSDEQISWLGSIMALGAVFGSVCAGSSIEYIGRKGTLLFTSIPFIFGWLLMAYAGRLESPIVLLLGRFITGFCCGLVSLTAPVYIAETANPSKRGFLGSGFQLSVTLGVVLTFVSGKYLSWAYLAIINSIFPVLLLITMCLMPETPLWLIKHSRISEATEANLFLHGMSGTQNMEVEISPVINLDGLQTESNRIKLSELTKPHILKPILLCLSLMFFQQFSGVNALIFYTTTIFASTGSDALDPIDATIMIGVVQLVATFFACLLTDRAGRRILLMISGAGCGVSILLMSIYYFLVQSKGSTFQTSFGWIPIMALICFMIAFSLGLGPIPWLLMSELLPAHVKSVASGLTSSFNWMCAFLLTKFFQNIIDLIHESVTYFGLSIVCFICVLFVIFLLPETKGKSLAEIENSFRQSVD